MQVIYLVELIRYCTKALKHISAEICFKTRARRELSLGVAVIKFCSKLGERATPHKVVKTA
jgi:hypothetical protein